MQPIWKEIFLSVTNKETSEQQILHVAQQLSQTAEITEFSCRRCWGTFNDHSCEGLGLLFTEDMTPSKQHTHTCTCPFPDEALGPRKDDMYFITALLPATLTHPPLRGHPEATSSFWVYMQCSVPRQCSTSGRSAWSFLEVFTRIS